MGLFKRRSDNPDEVQTLRAEIEAMGRKLAQTDARAQHASSQAESLISAQSQTDGGTLNMAPAPGSDVDSLAERIDLLAARIDEVDARMAAVANELAVQIDEVGRDGTPVDELRQAQVRLANEQARYQIQFNQNLAELAERVRRGDVGEGDSPVDGELGVE